jgi:hypothetical protein
MRGCRTLCGHRETVHDYRAERIRQADIIGDLGHARSSEVAEAREGNPVITFKDWLRYRAAS